MSTVIRFAALLLIALVLALPAHLPMPAMAQEAARGGAADSQIEQLSARVERVSQAILSAAADREESAELQTQLQALRDRAAKLQVDLRSEIAPAEALLAALGAKPEDGSEPESIAAERRDLEQRVSEARARVKRAELLVARTTALLREISERRRQRLVDRLFTQVASPLRPAVWGQAAGELLAGTESLAERLGDGVRYGLNLRTLERLLTLAAGLLVFGAVGWLLRTWLGRLSAHPGLEHDPGLRALVGFLRRLAFPLPLVGLLYLAASSAAAADPLLDAAASVLLVALWFVGGMALVGALLAPRRGNERLLVLEDAPARMLHDRLVALTFMIALTAAVYGVGQALEAAPATTTVLMAALAIVFAVPALSLLTRSSWLAIIDALEATQRARLAAPPTGTQRRALWTHFRVPLIALTLLAAFAGIAGYEHMARFVVVRAGLAVFLVLLLIFIHYVIADLVDRLARVEAAPRAGAAARDGQRGWWILLIADSILVLCGIAGLLLLWGRGWEDISDWTTVALTGFDIGNVHISPSAILVAGLLFAGVLAGTRFLQRKIEQRVLAHTRFDSGLRNSIKAGIGYLGVLIGSLAAISAAGIDLSNLALIAGALSVGIGFGLQNVVNNFVSGVILLAERPIRVGDWVVVGGYEGFVRRINVRSTEIETFDNASVIVPNSELISNTVMNWTHKNMVGRVIVPVGVAYGSDTEKVRQVLEKCVRDHPDILDVPTPRIVFRGFGDSSLNFEIRAFLRDISYLIVITSDLCFAIDKAFRENGIEIPFPQRDLHVRDLDRIEAMVDRALSRTPRGPAPGTPEQA